MNAMNALILKSDPRSPEVAADMKKRGQIVVEVTISHLYVLDATEESRLPQLMKEWFETFRCGSHAYRDGSKLGGADKLIAWKNLTE